MSNKSFASAPVKPVRKLSKGILTMKKFIAIALTVLAVGFSGLAAADDKPATPVAAPAAAASVAGF